MKVELELEHSELIRARLDVNGNTKVDIECNKKFFYTININESTDIELWFWPWKIKPILRIDGYMLDYSLLNVNQYDHQLCFTLHTDYLDRYGKNLIQSRIDTQFPDGKIVKKLYESVIGYNLDYSELIDKIKEKIKR